MQQNTCLTKEQARNLLALPSDILFKNAEELCYSTFGANVELCAIINARSGNCSMDCAFCSQAKTSTTPIQKHPLLPQQTLYDTICSLAHFPLAHIGLVTSGGTLEERDVASICELLSKLPDSLRKKICGSLGKLPKQSLLRLKDAGLTRIHHNLETSETFYPSICTTQLWRERLATVMRAQDMGFSICCGGLFGMGETWDDRIDLAFTLKEHAIKNIPINFLYPHKNTPLAHQPPMPYEEAKKLIALFRHILPEATLRICGGRPTTFSHSQSAIFSSGANALMVGDYLTTKGAGIEHDLILLKQCHRTPTVSCQPITGCCENM